MHTHTHTRGHLPSLPLSSTFAMFPFGHQSLTDCLSPFSHLSPFFHLLISLSCPGALRRSISVFLLCEYPRCWSSVPISACITVRILYLLHRTLGFSGCQHGLTVKKPHWWLLRLCVHLWSAPTVFQLVIMTVLYHDGNVYCDSSDP